MAWTLVTGGAKRLGATICRTLAEHKFNILVHYNTSEEDAAQVVKDCRALGVLSESIKGDFATSESTKAFIKSIEMSFPKIENLINNVGNFALGTALSNSPQIWKDLYQTNFHAPLLLIDGLLPSIVERKGSIINIGTSGIGNIKAETKYTAYNSTKTALLGLTKSLAKELAPAGVRVNMVSPGQLDISVDETIDTNLIPMKRVGTCAEVSKVVEFLLRKENSYITGQNIEVAGGLGL